MGLCLKVKTRFSNAKFKIVAKWFKNRIRFFHRVSFGLGKKKVKENVSALRT